MQKKKYEQLTPSQKKAVLHTEGPLLVIAGPGSGKTRVITYRIAALIDSGVSPQSICAITFTNKAADQMRQRTIDLGTPYGPHISTFHSLCVRILREFSAEAAITPNFSIYDDTDQTRCIRQAVKDCDLDTTNFPPARMLDAISTLKNRLIDVEDFKSRTDDFFSVNLAKIYHRYQSILDQNNALDFDDLLMKAARLLSSFPDVCSKLGNRFRFLLIDEYQDTNHAQYVFAKTLVSAHNNICATGDPDQSIYRWRGADIRHLLDFESDWPDATIVKLEENFRSTPNILELADRLIAANQNRKLKKLLPTRPAGSDVIVSAFEDEQQEANGIAQQVKQLTEQGVSLRDVAVFYRVNAMSRVLEEAFIQNKTPYQIVRGVEFYTRKEIRDLLAYLKVLANPDDEIALLRIINTPTRGIGKTTIDKVQSHASIHGISFFDALKNANDIDSLSKSQKTRLSAFTTMIERFKAGSAGNVAPLAKQVFAESELEKSLQADNDALENVKELINAAAKYDKDAESPSLLDYLQQISLFSDTDTYDASTGRIALMTLHAAKGLEFENVFIVGLEDGLLPHQRVNDDREEVEEERRLFFVGITRAKSRLHISYSRYRTIMGQLMRTIPSRFLYELGIDFGSLSQEGQQLYDETDSFDDDAEIPHFSVNQRVRHKTFGLGRVKEFIDMGQNSIVVVKFNTGQTKSLMLKYADLSKAENS